MTPTDIQALLTTFMLLYVGWLIFQLATTMRMRAIKEAIILVVAVWVGWSVHAWPLRAPGDGMLLVFGKLWLVSARSLAWVTLKALGVVDAWHVIVKAVT